MNTAQNGKGDTPRPMDGDRFRSGWDLVFGMKRPVENHKFIDGNLTCEKRKCRNLNDHAARTRSDINK
jgi:hypothetical protein